MLMPLFDVMEGAESTPGTYIFFAIISFFLMLPYICSVILHIIQVLGLYRIGKRRGIRHPWLAWLPCGNNWLLGCISDHYQLIVRGKKRCARFLLLSLSVLTTLAVFLVLIFTWELPAQLMNLVYTAPLRGFLHIPLVKSSLFPVTASLVVLLHVLRLFPLYRLYQSSVPRHRILFLIINILIPFSPSVTVFVASRQDNGMPPKRADIRFEEE